MNIENLPKTNLDTLRIHTLSQEQYDALAPEQIEENALYLIPNETNDLTLYETKDDAAKKLQEAKEYTDKSAAPDTLMWGNLRLESDKTNEDLLALLDGVIAKMPDNSIRHYSLEHSPGKNPLPNGYWTLQIDRMTNDVVTVTANSRYIAINGYINETAQLILLRLGGIWQPWEWVNPLMAPNNEYRTTERIDEKAVYKRNNNGVIQYRLDGETTWKDYANAVGAAPKGLITYTPDGGIFRCSTNEEIDTHMETAYNMLTNQTASHFVFAIDDDKLDLSGGGHWFVTMYRSDEKYGFASAVSYDTGNRIRMKTRSRIEGSTPGTGVWTGWVDDINSANFKTHITPASIDAAPAGYGLGVNDNYIRISSISELDNFPTVNGRWGAWAQNGPLLLEDVAFNICSVRYEAANYNYGWQYVDFLGGEIIRRTYSRTSSPNWGAWEWVNPPMIEDKEYRTTEQYDGKAIYKRNKNGIIQYRLDGETAWKNYANAVGAAPDGFGLGGTATFVTDLNEATETGFYYWNIDGRNTPFTVANGGGSMLVIKRNDSYIVQYAFNNAEYTPVMAARVKTEGAWSSWVDDINSANFASHVKYFKDSDQPNYRLGMKYSGTMTNPQYLAAWEFDDSADGTQPNRVIRGIGADAARTLIGAAEENHTHTTHSQTNMSNTDLNTIKTPGWYYGYTGMTHAPVDTIAVMEVIVYSQDWLVQRFTAVNGYAYERHWHSGTTWSDWKVIITTGNIANVAAPAYTYGTTDLTPGSSNLETGKLYFVYE